jgi:hypothetical protein
MVAKGLSIIDDVSNRVIFIHENINPLGGVITEDAITDIEPNFFTNVKI